MVESGLERDCVDINDPGCWLSRTSNEKSNQAMPKTEDNESRYAKLLMDETKPMLAKSRTSSKESSLTIP